VTALYELVPAGIDSPLGKPAVDPLKYQATEERGQKTDDRGQETAVASAELLMLKLRYQPPSGGASTLLAFPLKDHGGRFASASSDMQFAAAVATFGMLLRHSQFTGNASYAAVLETAVAARGEDQHGLRTEFLKLVEAAQRLAGERVGAVPAGWQLDRRPVAHAATFSPAIEAYRPDRRALATTSTDPKSQWKSSLPLTEVFLLGILAGVAAAVGSLAIGVRIAAWRTAIATSGCCDRWDHSGGKLMAQLPAGK
jgi:hypothetical protein